MWQRALSGSGGGGSLTSATQYNITKTGGDKITLTFKPKCIYMHVGNFGGYGEREFVFAEDVNPNGYTQVVTADGSTISCTFTDGYGGFVVNNDGFTFKGSNTYANLFYLAVG